MSHPGSVNSGRSSWADRDATAAASVRIAHDRRHRATLRTPLGARGIGRCPIWKRNWLIRIQRILLGKTSGKSGNTTVWIARNGCASMSQPQGAMSTTIADSEARRGQELRPLVRGSVPDYRAHHLRLSSNGALRAPAWSRRPGEYIKQFPKRLVGAP